MKTTEKFARNSIFNIIGHIITLPIMILIAPYMIRELGKANYGIWALAGVITSYAQLSDLGITKSLVKFVAEDWFHKDINRISIVLSTAFYTFAVIGGLVVIIILAIRSTLVTKLLAVPSELQTEALFVVSGIAVIFYLNLLFSVYNSALQGIQRMDIVNGIQVSSNILRALGTYLFLYLGWGLKGLIINSAICSILAIAVNVISTKRLVEGLKIHPRLTSMAELKRIWGYSSNVFLSSLLGLFQTPTNKVILSRFTSLVHVTFYQLGNQVQGALRTLFEVGMNPLLPAASELQSSKNNHELERIYFGMIRIIFLIVLPCVVLFIVLAKPIFQVWMGNGYELAAISLQFLLFAHFISMTVLPQYIVLMGYGNPRAATASHIISSGVNTLVALVLVLRFGLYGVLIGETISYFLAAIYLQVTFRKLTTIGVGRIVSYLPWKGILLSIMLGILIQFIIHFVYEWSLIKLLLVAISYLIVYAALALLIRVFDEIDKKLFLFIFRNIKELLPCVK